VATRGTPIEDGTIKIDECFARKVLPVPVLTKILHLGLKAARQIQTSAKKPLNTNDDGKRPREWRWMVPLSTKGFHIGSTN